jgi:hypothetical protein
LNQEITGDFTLSKESPLILERELYISKEHYNSQREFIIFNEIIIELAPE